MAELRYCAFAWVDPGLVLLLFEVISARPLEHGMNAVI